MADKSLILPDGHDGVRHADGTRCCVARRCGACGNCSKQCEFCWPPNVTTAYQAQLMTALRQPEVEFAIRRLKATCDGCGCLVSTTPCAWKCEMCDNYDLCDACFTTARTELHPLAHTFHQY